MYSINRVQLSGNLTKEPELKVTPSGKYVCSFSIATNYKAKDGTESVEFHNCVAWEKLAQMLQNQQKGQRLFIEGKLQTRSWEAEGIKKYKTEILVSEIFASLWNPKGGATDVNTSYEPPIEIEEIAF